MMSLRVLFHTVRADFLERVRRYGALITLGLTIFVTTQYLPGPEAGYVALHLGGVRGIYNSAWVGGVVTIMCVIFIALPGFYLVKNAVQRDRETGVGQIIATTPIRRGEYVLGKWLSNLCFLAVIAGVAMLAALGLQILRGESLILSPGDYVMPYLLIILPMMAVVAALAVLFEAVPWLRGGAGNVIFFFSYAAALTALAFAMFPQSEARAPEMAGRGRARSSNFPSPRVPPSSSGACWPVPRLRTLSTAAGSSSASRPSTGSGVCGPLSGPESPGRRRWCWAE
jgi:ABC-type transport system involved in multi-copper enzyme maturation permease subunit